MTVPDRLPDRPCDTRANFGIETAWPVLGFDHPEEHVPALDPAFRFEPETTRALLMGFAHGRRVYLYGPHGSGIE